MKETIHSFHDDFNRQDLGKDWTIHDGLVAIIEPGHLGIIHRNAPKRGLGIVTWTSTNFGKNQFSEITISRKVPEKFIWQVFVHRAKDGHCRYGFHYFNGRWQMKLERRPDRSLGDVPGPIFQPGDRVRIEVKEDHIRGLHNGTEIISARVPELLDQEEPGEPGFALNVAEVSRNAFPLCAISDWKGGNLAVSGSSS